MTGHDAFGLAVRAIALDRSVDPLALCFALEQRWGKFDGELDGGTVALEGVEGGG